MAGTSPLASLARAHGATLRTPSAATPGGPVTRRGIRWWRITEDGYLGPMATYTSHSAATWWNNPTRATCLQHDHRPPVDWCSCGVYAWPIGTQATLCNVSVGRLSRSAQRISNDPRLHRPLVFGLVELSGRILGDWGASQGEVRGEIARPVGTLVVGVDGEPYRSLLKLRYDVDVVVDRDSNRVRGYRFDSNSYPDVT